MSDITNRTQTAAADAHKQVDQAREAAHQRALEDERRKSLEVQSPQQKQALHAGTSSHEATGVKGVEAHKEAGRLEDSARKFQAGQAHAERAPAAPAPAKIEQTQELMKVAAFQRQRDAMVKG